MLFLLLISLLCVLFFAGSTKRLRAAVACAHEGGRSFARCAPFGGGHVSV